MTRHPLQFAIVAALFASLALAGCKKKDDTTTSPASEPAASAPVATPAPQTPGPATTAATTLTVANIDLGNAIGADNHIAAPTTTFAKSDTIHASVATDGPGGNLTAKWTMGDKVVDTQDKTVPAGPQVTEFSISKPDGWPVGQYTLQVSANGNVLQRRDFQVK